MGHQITKKSSPRRGSLQYWPITRSDRPYHNITNYASLNDGELSGFAGYKAGMVHLFYTDSDKNSPTFKGEVMSQATVLECPPLFVCAIRFYGDKGPIGESWASGVNKNVARTVKFKENNANPDELKAKASDMRLLVSTQPWLISLKKKPELFEMGIGGSIDLKFKRAAELLGKEIDVHSVVKDGVFIDVSAVTKGRGFAGSVKRWGVKIYPVHASKSRRKAGNLGAEGMAKVQFTVPQHGRLGYNSRIEYNKFVFKVLKDPKEIGVKAGFKRYGNPNSSVIVLRGSVPGSTGRLVIMRKALRPTRKAEPVKVTFV